MLLKFQRERRPCRILNIAWIGAPPKAMTGEGLSAPRTALVSERVFATSRDPLPGKFEELIAQLQKVETETLKANICPPRTDF